MKKKRYFVCKQKCQTKQIITFHIIRDILLYFLLKNDYTGFYTEPLHTIERFSFMYIRQNTGIFTQIAVKMQNNDHRFH